MNCTYHYPAISLKITDLVNGYDACQFAVDQGRTFWGHMLVDNACIRVALTNGHPDLVAAGLGPFRAAVRAELAGPDLWELQLEGLEDGQVPAEVQYQGFYFGYDENGDGQSTDWHGFTKAREPVAILGRAEQMPFRVTWDTSMLPAQNQAAVCAVVRFRSQTNLIYVTPARGGIEIKPRANRHVTLYASHDLPQPFWSRAGQKRACSINLDVDPASIEHAELHVNAWTGGPGGIKDYFRINGVAFPVAEGSRHELVYSRLDVKPEILVKGLNRIELLSDTEHHGIEILLPGPCLMIRSK
ncbi:MAG: hypothetical protein U1G07_01305 [Verrucomicrobiota bacterium]